MVATPVLNHFQPATVAAPSWSEIDSELATTVSPVCTLLSSDSISLLEAADQFNTILHSHLVHHGLVKDSKPGLNNSGNVGTHRECGVVALTRRLAKTKNQVRSETGVSRPFLTAVRAHNRALKAARQASLKKSAVSKKRTSETTLGPLPKLFARVPLPNKTLNSLPIQHFSISAQPFRAEVATPPSQVGSMR